MNEKNKNPKLPLDPETAAKSGQTHYLAQVTNPETNETLRVLRPIFIENSKKSEDGVRVVPAYLYQFFNLTEKIVYLRNNALGTEIRYIYKKGVYKPSADNDVRKIMLDYIEAYKYKLQSEIWAVDTARQLLDSKSPYIDHDSMNADESVINFQNGILNLFSMQFKPHTPELLSTIQIPCDWTGKQTPTPIFDRFIETLTSGDKSSAKLLLQYMGAVISNIDGAKFKKALFLVGDGNTGKSRISSILRRILGKENTSERSLKRLSERFGETAVYMKRLIFSSDLSFMKIDQMDRFKELTGGDTISVEFKNREPFDYRFKGLLLFSMNQLPRFGGDRGNHVYDRMLIIKCGQTIPEHLRDPCLEDKLFDEREGIIFKCVTALLPVIANGCRFDVPEECKINIEEYKEQNSSVIEFWNECSEPCADGESCVNNSQLFYSCFVIWSKERGLHYISSFSEFRQEVSAYVGKP